MGAENTWIDLSDEAVEGNWVDSEGQTTSYLPWAPSISAPNGGIGENCAYQHANENGVQEGKWDDTHCIDTRWHCVLCEKPMTTTTPGI